MWSESLKIRLTMTAGWLVLAACLLLVARLTGPVSPSILSASPADMGPAPTSVRMVDQSTAPTADDAG